jgi:DNA-binding transcriptional LysR family regulator
VTFEDFCNEPMVMLSRKSQARNMVERIYRKRGKILHVATEAVECNATLQFVSLGRGISILPLVPAVDASPVRSIPIDDSEFSRHVYLSWSKDRQLSPGAQQLQRYILEHFPKNN